MSFQSNLYELEYHGVKMRLFDLAESHAIAAIMEGMHGGDYQLDKINPKQGKILDIGAHVGIISILLSKTFPDATIYAIEPFPLNYMHLVHNLKENDCKNVIPMQIAVSRDGRPYPIASLNVNTGSASIHHARDQNECGPSAPLDVIFSELLLPHENFSFVKVDCEGAEYEIFESFTQWHRIEDLSVELHQLPGDQDDIPGWRIRAAQYAEMLKTKPIKGTLYVEY